MAPTRLIALLAAALLAGCAAFGSHPVASADACRPEVDRLNALLAAEMAERQKMLRVAHSREEALRRQIEALKSIERDILNREERIRSEAR